MDTFPDVLRALLAGNTGRPLITFYDLDSGERVEQSVATYANWVAKVSGLLGEYDVERGTRVHVALPTHWLTPVFVGAVANLGAVLSAGPAEVNVLGPADLGQDGVSLTGTTLACSLLPLGRPFADALPPGVVDVGKEVWSQPDSFVPWDLPAADDAFVGERTQHELWREADDPIFGGRVLTTANPAGAGLDVFAATLAAGGSLVLVRGTGDLDAIATQEQVTHRV